MMFTLSDMIAWALIILASYRIGHLIAIDKGFPLVNEAREWAKGHWQGTWYYELIKCPICQSLIYTLIFSLVLYHGSIPAFLVYWLSASGVTIIIHVRVYS